MLKIIGYIGAGLLILVLIGGVGYSLMRRTEGYRAQEQNFYSFEPHFLIGGCARYDAFKKRETPAQNKSILSKPQKKIDKQNKLL